MSPKKIQTISDLVYADYKAMPTLRDGGVELCEHLYRKYGYEVTLGHIGAVEAELERRLAAETESLSA